MNVLPKNMKFKALPLGCNLSLAGLIVLFYVGILIVLDWGWWRSESYSLLGVEAPFEMIYASDLSNIGREGGYYVLVYKLPENIEELLEEKKSILSEYPLFSNYQRGRRFKRFKWSKELSENSKVKRTFNFNDKDVTELPVMSLAGVKNDIDAEQLGRQLLQLPSTLCACWVKYQSGGDYESLSSYQLFVLNIKERVLIRFGLN